MPPEIRRDSYSFAIVKNFPTFKSFAILKEHETSMPALFVKTLSKLLKGA